jgi:hypothetical protein
MTQRQRSRKAWAKWRKVVFEQARSGQSVAAYCRERGLCAPHFFAWKKRLREAEAAEFVEVKLAAAEREPGAGREAAIPGAPIEIRLKNDRRLLVGPNFDADHLRSLLAVVESAT